MSVAADIILIIAAIQSNGNLSYTLNASAGQKKDAHAKTKMRCACAGINEVRMRRPKLDAHEQVKIKCACAGQNKMCTRRPK